MKNILRRFFTLSLCLFVLSAFIFAQQTTDDSVDANTQIERSFSIPSTTDTGFSDDTSTGSTAWVFIRMVLVLAVICFLIWFIGKFIKKRMEPGAEPDFYLKKTSQLTLAPGQTVQVITLRDRAYVLGVSEGGISVIDKIDGKGKMTEEEGKTIDKELIDDMNLRSAENLSAKPQDFASMISSLSSSSKRTENFLKSKRLNLRNNGEGK